MRKIRNQQTVRYLFFGACTTAVNLSCFWMFRAAGVGVNLANPLSIIFAVLFAYFVNANYVFQARPKTRAERWMSFGKFTGARGFTMLVELISVWLLVDVCVLQDMAGKVITQLIVLVLNYVLSKRFVFCQAEGEPVTRKSTAREKQKG